jgi:hypothetical protein
MLNLNDLKILAQLIDVASRRGLFGAAEMTAIGQLHEKLIQEIHTQEPKEAKATAEQPTKQ